MNYPTIRFEGAILSPDLLDRIETADGQKPTDFGFETKTKVKDEIVRAWADAQDYWRIFQHRLGAVKEGSWATSETRNLWVIPLLQLLGHRPEHHPHSLELGDKSYPISHTSATLPIHIIGFHDPAGLDRKPENATRRMSAHALLQEYLNLSEQLYGLLCNGRQLRLLRDSSRLVKLTYLEFDLERIFNDGLFADFATLFRLLHASRLPTSPENAPTCWLEKYHQESLEQGARIREGLRQAVTEALELLGNGFLAHPPNQLLRQQLAQGQLTPTAYFQQLLRLIYRLLFLLVAEERQLLFPAGTSPQMAGRYHQYYSLRRLRRLANSSAPPEARHHDGWLSLLSTFHIFEQPQAAAHFATSPLGGHLFQPGGLAVLAQSGLGNKPFFQALARLGNFYHTESKQWLPVNYGALATEEFGAVYESLLELHPQIQDNHFFFQQTAGNERKTSGSYYTPAALVDNLLETALDPLLAERESQFAQLGYPSAEAAILDLKVCDPACGSGHFLIAAAQRMARRLAVVRAKGQEPAPHLLRESLRQIISQTIYGVDLNPMAVELCKVGLWLEAMTPGKPLTFLDHHIQCGNSLLGATPTLLAAGIPDEAFEPISGDDKKYCGEWKRRNKQQRTTGQRSFRFGQPQPWEQLGNLPAAFYQLNQLGNDTLPQVQAQEANHAQLLHSTPYINAKLWADAWCAAFVWLKRPEKENGWAQPLTEQIFRNLGRNPFSEKGYWADIQQLAEQYQFFHWHLAFPEIFSPNPQDPGRGFDLVLGNPPWERIKIQEKEWFSGRDSQIANAPNTAARQTLIAKLPQTNPTLAAAFAADKRKAEGESHFVRHSGRYPLCGRGDVNTYTLFAELVRQIQGEQGRVGVIVPSGIATDDTTKFYFQDVMDTGALANLYDFENRNGLFPGVHRSYKFCLLTLTGRSRPETTGSRFFFFAHEISDLQDTERLFRLTAADIALLNPNTRTCPIFRSQRDAELTKAIYRRVPVLQAEGSPDGNPWGIHFLAMFHMSADSGLFRTRKELEAAGWQLRGNQFWRGNDCYLPLYEAKLFHHFNHRWATYIGNEETRYTTAQELANPAFAVLPRYWVPAGEVYSQIKTNSKWLIGLRRFGRATDERTLISDCLPKNGCGDSATILNPTKFQDFGTCLVANLNSFVLDFVARQKIGGVMVNQFIVNQLPILPPETYQKPCPWAAGRTIADYLLPRVLELTYTSHDLRPFAESCGYFGPPFAWDEERRFLLRCQLDAAFFHLYAIPPADVAYIMDTFPIISKKDNEKYGHYRTKDQILQAYESYEL